MKDLVTKQTTNFNLYIVLTICSLLIGIPTKVLADTLDSHHEFSPTSSSQPKSSDFNSTLLSQNRNQRAELDAFFSSKYNSIPQEGATHYILMLLLWLLLVFSAIWLTCFGLMEIIYAN